MPHLINLIPFAVIALVMGVIGYRKELWQSVRQTVDDIRFIRKYYRTCRWWWGWE